MKRLDYQKTFDKVLTGVDKEDFKISEKSEYLFTIADTIPVYKDNTMMARSGGIVAYISLKSHNMRPFIMVDSIFESLSLNAKIFAIYHELGHYQNGDFLSKRIKFSTRIKNHLKSLYRNVILKEYPEKEILADYYATDRIGSSVNAIDALNEISSVIQDLVKDKKKLKKLKQKQDKRIQALTKMINEGPYFISDEPVEFEGVFSDEEYDEEEETKVIKDIFEESDNSIDSVVAAMTELYEAELMKINK